MATRRRRRKRRNGSFVLSLFTFLIVIGAIVASVTVFLKVADIQVNGSVRYAAADIIESSGIKTGDNMFLVNKFEVADKLLSEYPYIEQIKIRRKLPDTFTFEITERVAAAYVMSDGNRWLIDNNAYILERIAPDAEVKVPKVSGCEVLTPYAGSPLVLKNADQLPVLREVLTSLRYTGMTESIMRVEIDKLYDINLIYGDRFLIALGDASQLAKR
ncbi:MAG: FtsQ-type POTRA domain-containing protein [Oscillospiraceae bacterium]|nr:FtsQ-type POTRA domain-containing protein [Oscillospiraceae bacterium]